MFPNYLTNHTFTVLGSWNTCRVENFCARSSKQTVFDGHVASVIDGEVDNCIAVANDAVCHDVEWCRIVSIIRQDLIDARPDDLLLYDVDTVRKVAHRRDHVVTVDVNNNCPRTFASAWWNA